MIHEYLLNYMIYEYICFAHIYICHNMADICIHARLRESCVCVLTLSLTQELLVSAARKTKKVSGASVPCIFKHMNTATQMRIDVRIQASVCL